MYGQKEVANIYCENNVQLEQLKHQNIMEQKTLYLQLEQVKNPKSKSNFLRLGDWFNTYHHSASRTDN